MVQWLSKLILISLILTFLPVDMFAQPQTGGYGADDYKDPKTHERFRKRRLTVSAWQINELKKGAIVVRLKTNSMLINEFKKRGDDDMAEKTRMEQAAININTIRAFRNHFNFCKVYFIYSHSSDSLQNGTRSGIFIDSNLRVNPSISLKESFYLVGESDYVYNSSIGFVREDSARYVTETGNPSASEFPIVLKNKFGHQLKNPFPFAPSKFVFTKNVPSTEVVVDGKPIVYNVSSGNLFLRSNGERRNAYTYNGKVLDLTIPRMMTYDVLSQYVEQLNSDLEAFYRESAGYTDKSPNYFDAKPFMY